MPATSSRPWHVHEVLGRRVRAHDTLGTFRRVIKALEDEDLDPEERFWVLARMVYVDAQAVFDAFGTDFRDALSETLWACYGIDIDGTRPHDDRKAFDLDEDEARIAVTVREAYGLDMDALEDVPYREVVALIVMAPRETPMGQAVLYRLGKPPKRTKWNAEEVRAWNEARDFYRLRGAAPNADPTETANAAASSAFEAVKRRALAARKGQAHG